LVRYDSPSLHGFIFSASIAEAGDVWGTMLRYANEFSGFRVAAGIGYEKIRDRTSTAGTAVPADLTAAKPDTEAWGGSLAILHVPTGLFAQGHYLKTEFGGGASAYWGQSTTNRIDATQWLIQAGITRNWFGFGNTAIYGEYSKNKGWGAQSDGRDFTTAGFTAVNDVTDTEMTMWGFGITQNLDAAATELYLDYRHFSADVTTTGGAKLDTEDFGAVIGGARVKF
jgi:hypothetical protein